MKALEMGIRIHAPGYNTFVTGLSGSGRTHAIQELLERLPTPNRRGHDRAYVHNFDDPSRPRLLELPRGAGVAFKDTIQELVEAVRTRIPQILEEEAYLQKRRAIADRARAEEKALVQSFETRLKEDGFALAMVQGGQPAAPSIVPVIDGKPVPIETLKTSPEARAALEASEVRKMHAQHRAPSERVQIEAAVDAAIADLERRLEAHRSVAEELGKKGRQIAKRTIAALVELERNAVRRDIEGLMSDVKVDWPSDKVAGYLDAMLEHIMAHPWLFTPSSERPDAPLSQEELQKRHAVLAIYGVNVVQTSSESSAPVVIERHPTFTNVFGTIERETASNNTSDYSRIRPGSLLRADGGFLIMYARDVLSEPGVWRSLVRTLRSGQLQIQRPDSAVFLVPSAMKPEPIAIDTKVILIGDDFFYHLLSHYEEDFLKVFKLKAEFDLSIAADETGISEFAQAVRAIQQQEGIRPLALDGWAALAEQAARVAGDRSRLSTRFGALSDLLIEANFLAGVDGIELIGRRSIEAAIQQSRARHELHSDTVAREIQNRVLLIDTDGATVGQINGLAVFGTGVHRFGKPTRITASVGAGRGGLINIEREAHLSGPTHDKGILILAGYLRSTYGRRMPLALTASIAFEQSYGGVDGDSASLAELYALLSAISGRPLAQSIAVTGSINQRGDVQAIGGANEKIEGFFDIALARGLARHGCIIPSANQRHLMLHEAVVEAAREGTFQVWAVATVDEGIELMFGVPADELHETVARELRALAELPSIEPSVQRIEPSIPHREAPPDAPKDPRPPGPTEGA